MRDGASKERAPCYLLPRLLLRMSWRGDSPPGIRIVRPYRLILGKQGRHTVGFAVGHNDPVKWVSCPGFSKCHFGNDGKRVIADRHADLYIQLDLNLLWRDDNLPDLVQVLQLHYGHRRNAKIRDLYRGKRLL
jgi:hypothetical protein